ncbi:phosphomannomutase [Rhodobacteraceae bacterium CCMM004]|nr:phosphomannomutase [Rhodobacteraceae bacterium CCMM004]
MAPKFGTSGLRGLVVELTDALVADHVRAFLSTCETGGTVYLGQDLRPSSPRIADTVAETALAAGCHVVDCGAVPTPALALAAETAGAGAVMVTGSHIPADRNGLKFYGTAGEIGKDDEAAIVAALGREPETANRPGRRRDDPGAADRFVARYADAFGPRALAGRRIGVYAHSAVGRDMLAAVLRALGAETVELGRSDTFVPVDTEALDPETGAMLADWVRDHRLDAVASTDGDSDRPMLADETGRIVPGDLLGQITAAALGVEVVVTPVSSNSGVVLGGRFATVERVRIGSPYVIAGMAAHAESRVVGYEANGGFLLGFEARGPAGPLPPLATRDSFLPIVVPLVAAGDGTLSARLAEEPPRHTASDRLRDVPTEASRALVARLTEDADAREAFLAFADSGARDCDLTDGLRITLDDGAVVHVRPSGNAPELRLYAEADDPRRATDLLAGGLEALRQHLR